MKYGFYGWETATVRDERGLTPRDYYTVLSSLWCAETCAPRMRKDWTLENRTLGQCSVTAFLLQDLFGGKVYGVPLGDGNFHCFNAVGDCVFDLTSEQFGGAALDYGNCPEQLRSAHFARAEKRERYEKLREMLLSRRIRIAPVTPDHLARYGEIYAAAFSGEPWNDPWDPRDAEIHVRELMESGQSYGLELETGGKTAGFLLGTSMLFHYGRVFEINDLAVDPALQGQGIASMLLDHCVTEMKARGMAGIHLITGAEGPLPAFYQRRGFQREEKVILMGLEL